MSAAKFFQKLINMAADWLFVPCCPICDCPSSLPLCPRCRERMEMLYAPMELYRSEMLFDSACSAYDFSHPEVRHLVYALKLRGSRHGVKVAAKALHRMVSSHQNYLGADAITWIPRSEASIRKYGFDQAQLIAQELAVELELPCKQILFRQKGTGVQKRMDDRKKRKDNIKDAFFFREKTFGGVVILVDDMITSGASVNEGARMLKKSGYDRVRVLSLASQDKRITKSL